MINDTVKYEIQLHIFIAVQAGTTKLPGNMNNEINSFGTNKICLREHDEGQVGSSPTTMLRRNGTCIPEPLLLQDLDCRIIGTSNDGSQHRCRKYE
jgi:hypothetical protein